MSKISDAVQACVDRDGDAIVTADVTVSYRQYAEEVARRCALLDEVAGFGTHFGVISENTPEYLYWCGVAAVTGSTLVGLNTTRGWDNIVDDVTQSECAFVICETEPPVDFGVPCFDASSMEYLGLLAGLSTVLPSVAVSDDTNLFLIFTSGTTGQPKLVIATHGRVSFISESVAAVVEMSPADVAYVAMPLFHSNPLFVGWGPAMLSGATVALRRKFSARGFLDDIRNFGVTVFPYVGKPLAYIMETEPREDDGDVKLRFAFGNEARQQDIDGFAERFGCQVYDAYGQSETGATVIRVPGMPSGALGVALDTSTVVVDGDGQECERAVFDSNGKLLNPETAIGEIVNFSGGMFEGYYGERRQSDEFRTGDLAFRDSDGFFYFAGRTADWVRVDGENFATAPIERIVDRYEPCLYSSVIGVPDPVVGDTLVCLMEVRDGHVFDPSEFSAFLNDASDMGSKWFPRFVVVVDDMPLSASNKVVKSRVLDEAMSGTVKVFSRVDGCYVWSDGKDLSDLTGLRHWDRKP